MRQLLLAGVIALLPTAAMATQNCNEITRDEMRETLSNMAEGTAFKVLDVLSLDGNTARNCSAEIVTNIGVLHYVFSLKWAGGKTYVDGHVAGRSKADFD